MTPVLDNRVGNALRYGSVDGEIVYQPKDLVKLFC